MATNLTGILSTPPVDPSTQNSPAASPAPAAAPAPAASAPPEWLNSIPEAYRQDAYITAHNGLESLLAEYGVLKQTAGQSNIPDWSAPYEQHKDFFSKIGVPETPDKYELKVPEGFPIENFPINQEFLGKMQQIAHKHKIPASAFQELAAEYMGLEKGVLETQIAAQQAELENRDKALAELWGDKAEIRTQFTTKAFNQFSNAEEAAKMGGQDILTHPYFLHVMSKIGEQMQAPNSPGAASSSGASVQQSIVTTPAQAREAIEAMYSDPAKAAALNNPKDPNHKRMNAELEALYLKAYAQ